MKAKILLTFTCLLWKTLVWGQATLVKDIYPLNGGSNIISMESIGDKVVFNANNSITGNELWVSDGTEIGTILLKDIWTGTRDKSSYPNGFRKQKKTITFEADNGTGTKLFRSDGTYNGTYQIWDRGYYFGTYSAFGPLFFGKGIQVDTTIFWLTNVNNNGALILKDLNSDKISIIINPSIHPDIIGFPWLSSNGSPAEDYVIRFGDKWMFVAPTKDAYAIFISDGTKTGTVKLFSSKNLSGINLIKTQTPSGPMAFFSYDDGVNGFELWKTDGTVTGTQIVKNIAPGGLSSTGGSYLTGSTVNNGIIFSANDGITGYELWFSDGTASGTKLIKDFEQGNASGFGLYGYSILAITEDKKPYLYNRLSNNLWRTDGTIGGTKFLGKISFQNNPVHFQLSGDDLFYLETKYINNYESFYVMRMNIKTDNITKLGEINNAGTYPVKFAVTNNTLFYVGYNSDTGPELWKFPLCSHTAKINTPNGTSFCPGSSVSITGEGSGTTSPFNYKWKQGTTDAGTAATLAVTKAGTYTVEVTDKEGCTVSASVDITQTSNLPVSITGTNSICTGQSTTLTANVTGGVSPYTYQWKQNAVNVGTNATTYAASVAGSYSVGVTDSKGCTGTSAAYSVTQKPSPNVTVSTSRAPTLLTGESVVLSVPTASGQTYQWAKDGAAIAGATNNSYTVSGAGSYTVTVTGGGCTATSSAVMVSIILANEPLAEEVGLRVSPNPTVNQAKIVLQLAQSAAANVYVLDASGKRIRTWESAGKAARHEVVLDMRSVAAGSYVVQAEAEGQVFTEKLVKQ